MDHRKRVQRVVGTVCIILGLNKLPLTPARYKSRKNLTKTSSLKGVAAKLNQLEETFGMKFKHAHYLETLAKARNCLTHRLGIVGNKDCNNDKHLELKWQSIDLSIDTPDRDDPIPFNFPIEEPIYLEKGGSLMMKFVERKRRFAKDQKLVASSKELAEICHFVIIASNDVLTAMNDYAKSIGAAGDAQQIWLDGVSATREATRATLGIFNASANLR